MKIYLLRTLLSHPHRRMQSAHAAIFAAIVACITSISPANAQSAATVVPSDAKVILMRMADYLAKLQSFSVEVRDSYDTVQKSGQKIEFAEMRKITVARPDRMRLEVVESDGDRQTLTIDAKDIMLASQPANVFAQTPSPGNLDQAIVHFVRDLGMRLPFALLMVTNASAELEARTKTLVYVESTTIYGTPAHHVAGRTDGVDYQLWIADGDKPLPLRLVLTYDNDKGEPQFRAQFSDWNLAPQVTEATFASAAPQGAQRIAFLAEMPHSAAPKRAIKASASGAAANPGAKQ